MIPGCTHALDLELDDDTINLENYDVYVSIKQGNNIWQFSGEQIETNENKATVYLTQEESLQFKDYLELLVQMNWVSTNAITGEVERCASDAAVVPVGVQLLRRILP